MPISSTELKARIDSLAMDAHGSDESGLTQERAGALDRYFGRPYGDEMDGRSQIVSRDLRETVDWILPGIIKVFLQSGNIVEFVPIGPEDEQAAEQESDYVNHVIMEENDGFLLLHDWFKDALILKNGYAKCYVDEFTESRVERYEGLTEDELVQLLSQLEAECDSYEVIEQEEETAQTVLDDGTPINVPVFNIRCRVNKSDKRIRVEPIPAEEVRVSRRAHGDLDTCEYVEHKTSKTRSELIEMGMPKKFVSDLAAYVEIDEDEDVSRDTTTEGSGRRAGVDSSMDEVEYRECYVRVDYDNDGVAELRKVIIAGNEIPPGSEWNEEIDEHGICYLTPKRMPHRHIGESIDDEIEDIQEIKTVLQRNLLDNMYGLTNTEWLVNERVNLDDFLVTRPLGVKRVSDSQPIGDCAAPVVKPNILDKVLPTIDYFDRVRGWRTGVTEGNTGVNPDVLNNVTKGAYMENQSNANQKVEMVARMFAEIGVKPLVKKVHSLLLKHQDKEKMVKLRGDYVSVNPQEWRERNDLKINVGIGSGSREELRAHALMIGDAQQAAAQMGIVGPRQVYNSFRDLTESLGKPSPERYVMDPEGEEYHHHQQMMAQQNQQTNPLAEVEQIKAQVAQMIEQGKAQLRMRELSIKEAELNLEAAQFQAEQAKSQSAEAYKNAVAEQERAHAALLAEQKLASDERTKLAQLEQDERESVRKTQMDKYVADLRYQGTVESKSMDNMLTEREIALKEAEYNRKEVDTNGTLIAFQNALDAQAQVYQTEAQNRVKEDEGRASQMNELAGRLDSIAEKMTSDGESSSMTRSQILDYIKKNGSDGAKKLAEQLSG